MAKVERNVTIKAPVEKVFAYITNPVNRMEWVPGSTDIRDVIGKGIGQKWGYTYKMAGIPLKGESEVIEYIPNERYVHKSKGGVVSTWSYMFQPVDDVTRLEFTAEYTIPIPVLGKMGERLAVGRNEREADLAMTNIKERLEG